MEGSEVEVDFHILCLMVLLLFPAVADCVVIHNDKQEH